MRRGKKQKFNYDSDEFYQQIYILSIQGCTYKEIAQRMGLNHTVFSQMMNGKYRYWTSEENRKRSERLLRTMREGDLRINAIVRNTLFRIALGGIILHTTIRRYLIIKNADGNIISTQNVIEKTFERELPPNIKLLEKLLFHYDPKWRQIENLKRMKNEASVDECSSNEEWIKAKIYIGKDITSVN